MTRTPVLRVKDVARILGEERARARAVKDGLDERGVLAEVARAKPLSLRTVHSNVYESRREGGRYYDNPMPLPVYPDDEPKPGQIPVWTPDLDAGETIEDVERRIRQWWHSRPGPGVGAAHPVKMTATMFGEAKRMLAAGGVKVGEVAARFGISRNHLYKLLKEDREQAEARKAGTR